MNQDVFKDDDLIMKILELHHQVVKMKQAHDIEIEILKYDVKMLEEKLWQLTRK